jgi:hypothetical protein
MKSGYKTIEDAVLAQVNNITSTVVDTFKIVMNQMVMFIEDGVNWLINQLPAWIRPKSPLDLTGRYRLTGADYEDEYLGQLMRSQASGVPLAQLQVREGTITTQQATGELAAAALTSGTPLMAGDIGNIRQAYNYFAAERKKKNLSFITLPEFEEAVKNGTLDALHQRRSPSAMDLFAQNAKYSKDLYNRSDDYFKQQLSYESERASMQEQFQDTLTQNFRAVLSGMAGGTQGFQAPRTGAGYNVLAQQNLMRGFVSGGTKLFGADMGPAMGALFNRLAGNYLDQAINTQLAPMLGMSGSQLSRSINNLVASRQFNPQIKQLKQELGAARAELSNLEKQTGFSMAEMVKAGAQGGFNEEQRARYSALASLRNQIEQRQVAYNALKSQEKKFRDMALEDLMFGLTGVATGVRSFLGYEEGIEQLSKAFGALTAAPFSPLFGVNRAAGTMIPMGGTGGQMMMPGMGGGMMMPVMMPNGQMMMMPSMGGGMMPGQAGMIAPSLDDVMMGQSGQYLQSNMSFADRFKYSGAGQALAPILAFGATRALGNALGVKGVLNNMIFTSVAGSMAKDLIGSLGIMGGPGFESFSTMSSLGKAFGVKGITSASTFGQLATGIGNSVNNLLGGNIAGNFGSMIASGGGKLLSMQSSSAAYDFLGEGLAPTTMSGQLGMGMQSFGTGMQMAAGSTAGFSEAMSAGGSQAAGALAGTALSGISAYNLSKSLSGGYSAGKGVNYIAAVAAMIPGLQPFAPLIGLAGAVINRAFGRKPKEYTDRGLVGTIGESNMEVQQYADWMRKGGWFRSTKRGTEMSEFDQESMTAMTDAIVGRGEATRAFGSILGYTEDFAVRAKTFSKDIKVSFQGLDEEGITKAFGDMITGFSDDMIKSIYVGVEKFRIGEEDLLSTFQHLAESTMIFDEAMLQLGLTADDLSATFRSKTLADLAGFKEQLIGTFGGDTLEQQRQNFAQVVGTYFDIMYTETEKNQYAMDFNRRKLIEQNKQIEAQLAQVSQKLPEQFKGITEFAKVLDPEGMIDVEESLRKNYDNFRAVVDELTKIDEESALIMMASADEFDAAVKNFLTLEIDKQKKDTETQKIVADVVEPFKDFVGVVASTIAYEGGYNFGMSAGGGQSYISTPTYTPPPITTIPFEDAVLSGDISVTPASGTLGFLAEVQTATGPRVDNEGQVNPLYIDNSVTSTSSSPTTIVMNDDKIRDYHPILNSSERTLTYGYALARS